MLRWAGAGSSDVVCNRPMHGLGCEAVRASCRLQSRRSSKTGDWLSPGKQLVSPACRPNFRKDRATLRAYFRFRPVYVLKRTKAPRSNSLNSRGVLPRAMTNRTRPEPPLGSWVVCMVPSTDCHVRCARIGVRLQPDSLASASGMRAWLRFDWTKL